MPMPPKPDLPKFRTDHFKFYRVEINRDPRNLPIGLLGQFEPKDGAPRAHKVVLLTFFGVPVSKNREKIRNARTHLSWYKLGGVHEPNRTVRISNQFGDDALVLGDPELLLAPAMKQTGDAPKRVEIPNDVSHFKGYRILQHRPFDARTVLLQDQFDREPVRCKMDAPLYFCVPVAKTVADKRWPMQNPDEHLTIYPIAPQAYQQTRPVWDQFAGGVLRNFRSYFLAVPTLKTQVKKGVVPIDLQPLGRPR